MEQLTKLTLERYLELLGSDAPAPGGGSAAALTGAQGAALTSMVAALTIGKPKFAEYETLCRETKAKSDALLSRLTAQIDIDAGAYTAVASAYRMPKGTEAEQAARREAVQTALLHATKTPLLTMELAYETVRLTEALIGRSNPNAASDLGVAALNLSAAVRGAYLNVAINLPGLTDAALVKELRLRGETLLEKTESIARAILERTATR